MKQTFELNQQLDEREFELINIIGAKIGSTQRDLSRHLELSLGMTNMLIRRLIAKGFIRIRQLNRRKVEYILTPKGFSEKIRKSVRYTLKTIDSIGFIKEKLKKIIVKLSLKGEHTFFVLGATDLITLIEMAVKETGLKECSILTLQEIPEARLKGMVLVCKENVSRQQLRSQKYIDLIEELSKDEDMLTWVEDYKN